MKNATLRFLGLVVAVFLIGGGAPVQAQGAFAHGAVVALQGTPHLWIADDRGILHWGGDTRALSGKHVNWNDRRDVSLAELQTYPIGDPWLSAGLLKDGDPIYQVKWESDWPLPKLLHIQSIKDVELFGINGSNYGNFVIDKAAWEQRYGIDAATLERQPLASAVPPGVTLTLAPVPAAASQPTPIPMPTPAPTPTPKPTIDYKELFRNNEQYIGQEFFFKGEIVQVIGPSNGVYNFRVRIVGDPADSPIVYLSGYTGKRLLEDDEIEFAGEAVGLYTYRSIFGQSITIPNLKAVTVLLVGE